MKNRWYLLDFGDPDSVTDTVSVRVAGALRCGRFSSFDRARRELLASVGGRFALYDRATGSVLRKADV